MMKMGKFEKLSLIVLACTIGLYFIGIISIKSQESQLNIQSQKLENEIQSVQTNIESLDIQIQKKTGFDYLKDTATSRGYYYKSDVTAYIYSE